MSQTFSKKVQREAITVLVLLVLWLPAHAFLASLWFFSLPDPWPESLTAVERALLFTSTLLAYVFSCAGILSMILTAIVSAFLISEKFEDEAAAPSEGSTASGTSKAEGASKSIANGPPNDN